MMKRVYESPRAYAEMFTPNEYVAACGDHGTVYNFECNAGTNRNKYNVYLSDGTPYATSGRDSGGCRTDYEYYYPCGETHTADSDSGFLKGYMYQQGRRGQDSGEKIDVIIWTERYTNVHCTTNLNMDEWETAKS